MLFFFNDTAPTEIYTLSLHDALPISLISSMSLGGRRLALFSVPGSEGPRNKRKGRSEEHTSELQSLTNLVCRLLLEKKKKNNEKEDVERHRDATEQTALTHDHRLDRT